MLSRFATLIYSSGLLGGQHGRETCKSCGETASIPPQSEVGEGLFVDGRVFLVTYIPGGGKG